MAYDRVNWKDYPETDTPITAQNLNRMDEGIEMLDQEVGNTSRIAGIGDGSVSGAIERLDARLSQISLDEVILGNRGSNNNAIKFGMDSAGNYGFYKRGADTLTPFKNPQGTFTINRSGTYDITNYKYVSVNITTKVYSLKIQNKMQVGFGVSFGEYNYTISHNNDVTTIAYVSGNPAQRSDSEGNSGYSSLSGARMESYNPSTAVVAIDIYAESTDWGGKRGTSTAKIGINFDNGSCWIIDNGQTGDVDMAGGGLQSATLQFVSQFG